MTELNQWVASYIQAQKRALDSIPTTAVADLIQKLRRALDEDRQIFVVGNGGSASDKLGRRFRVLSLNDNVSWMTALGNDYCYDDVYVRQLMNYGRPGDLLLVLSVSGSSPNLVRAAEWAKSNQLHTIALVGAKRGELARPRRRPDRDRFHPLWPRRRRPNGHLPHALLRLHGTCCPPS